MTKKNYILIAETIKENTQGFKGWILKNGNTIADSSLIMAEFKDKIADKLAIENSRFDYTKFREACGFDR